jgi:hypothetical protein
MGLIRQTYRPKKTYGAGKSTTMSMTRPVLGGWSAGLGGVTGAGQG